MIISCHLNNDHQLWKKALFESSIILTNKQMSFYFNDYDTSIIVESS